MGMLERMEGSKGIDWGQDGRVCYKQNVTVDYLVASGKVLANSEYVARDNRVLLILGLTWVKKIN